MKNLKRLLREQLKFIDGGEDTDRRLPEAGCHCHGCGPSPSQPSGLPPADFYTPGSTTECWAMCDSYRQLCGK